jgi:ABC-type lipoprotein release transport system permease subunit
MAAVWLTARAEWRQRWRSFVLLAVLAGVAGGVALVAFTGSRRADTAFARLQERLKTPNVGMVMGERPDPELVRELATWPGAEVALHEVILIVAPADSGMVAGRDTAAFAFPVVAGDDPVDPFLIVEGRRYDERRADELVVNEAMGDALDADIGDRFSLVSLTPEQVEASQGTGKLPSPAGPTQQVRLVGVARTAEDVSDAPDPVLIVTPAYYERHGDAIARQEGVLLRVDEDRLPEFEDRWRSEFGDDARIEPPEDLAARIEDGLAVDVNGLRAFALVAAVAGLVALGQAFVRQADTVSEQHPARRALGMTSRQLTASGVIAALPVAAGAALLAAACAVAGGPLAVTGLARQAEPDPGPWFDWVVLPGAIVIGLVVLAVAAFAYGLATARGPAERMASARSPRGASLLAGLPPPASVGTRLALDTGRGPRALPSAPALAGAAIGVAGVVAALTFGARVDHLLATPKLWGANYNTIVTPGEDVSSGERTADQRTADQVASDPDVAAVALFDSIDLAVHAGERRSQVEAIALWDQRGTISPEVTDGRAPVAPDEVALGAEVLDRLDVDLGDTVEVDRAGEKVALRVVGRHLQPAEDTASSGMLMTPRGFEMLEGEEGDSGVLVRFAPHIDTNQALERLRGLGGQAQVTVAADDAPSNVDNLDELGALPLALAAFLALLAVIAAVHALLSTTRRRRRDLAILRVLGFVGGQVRSALRWQALTVAGVGVVIGVPAGVIAGRRIWSALAGAVGVVDDWSFPWMTVVFAVPAAMGVAVLLAVPPGHAAARVSPGRVLRAE